MQASRPLISKTDPDLGSSWLRMQGQHHLPERKGLQRPGRAELGV